jgi:hypothetical protein
MYAVEIRLFQDLRRSNALKAWLIVYRFGMQDPLLRTLLLKTGCQPWEEDYFFVGSLKSYWFLVFGFLVFWFFGSAPKNHRTWTPQKTKNQKTKKPKNQRTTPCQPCLCHI